MDPPLLPRHGYCRRRRGHPTQSDVDNVVSLVLHLYDMLQMALPRIATVEGRLSEMTAKHSMLEARLDRHLQRRNFRDDSAGAQPSTTPSATGAQTIMMTSHRGLGALPAPARPASHNGFSPGQLTPAGSITLSAEEPTAPQHAEAASEPQPLQRRSQTLHIQWFGARVATNNFK